MGEIKYRKPEEMKDSGVEWLGMIPREWEITKIKYLTKLNIRNLSNNEQKHLKVNYIDIGSVDSSGVITDVQEFNFEEAPSRARRILKTNDVIVSTVRTYLKAIAFIDKMYDGSVGSTGFAVFTPIDQRIDAKLFYYLIKSDKYVNHIVKNSVGVSYPAINAINISNFFCAYPQINMLKNLGNDGAGKLTCIGCLNEQQRIANFLEIKTAGFDSIIAKKEKLIAKLEEAKKSLISEVVTGKVKIVDGQPVKRQPEEMKDSGVEWLRMIPKGWSIDKFSRVINIPNGQVDPRKKPYMNMILIAPNHIESNSGRVIELQTAKEQGADSGKYFCQKGDVIYSKIRPNLCKVCIAPIDCLCSADMYPMKADKGKLLQDYLLWILLSDNFTKYVILESDRVAMPKVNRESLAKFRLPISPIPEQNRLNKYLTSMDKQFGLIIEKVKDQIVKLKEAKQALISEAVTGKIDLRDWKIIEEVAQ